MALIDMILQELEQESRSTHRLLERVPGDQLKWKPHQKARTLGQLALHIARIPGAIAQLATAPSPVQAPQFPDPQPKNVAEVVTTYEQSLATAKEVLGGLDDSVLTETWRLVMGQQELLAIPRAAVLRTIMLNHSYHHRGQLSVYLRILGVPLPSIFGPSSDENPFG